MDHTHFYCLFSRDIHSCSMKYTLMFYGTLLIYGIYTHDIWNLHSWYMEFTLMIYGIYTHDIWNLHSWYMEFTLMIYGIYTHDLWNLHSWYMEYTLMIYRIYNRVLWSMLIHCSSVFSQVFQLWRCSYRWGPAYVPGIIPLAWWSSCYSETTGALRRPLACQSTFWLLLCFYYWHTCIFIHMQCLYVYWKLTVLSSYSNILLFLNGHIYKQII